MDNTKIPLGVVNLLVLAVSISLARLTLGTLFILIGLATAQRVTKPTST
jgi:hypothetical protein